MSDLFILQKIPSIWKLSDWGGQSGNCPQYESFHESLASSTSIDLMGVKNGRQSDLSMSAPTQGEGTLCCQGWGLEASQKPIE